MREKFEKLPEIANILKDEDTHWCNKRNMYVNQRVFQDSVTGFLNGAYCAFQAQQKKIDNLEELVDRIYSANEDSEIKSIIDGWEY